MIELALQKFAASLLRLNAAPDVIWFHPPNGEARSARTGGKLKAMGVKPGVPDLVVVLPGGHAHFLELKSARGSLSPHQRVFREDCGINGAPYEVATTPEEVESTLRDWGALRGGIPARASIKKAA